MTTDTPKLAPPGAGLPFIEGLIAKYYFYPREMRKFKWRRSLDRMITETDRIIAIAEKLTPEQFTQPVLIPHIVGMEDSSRFWSVAMVMEHLIITMRGMTQIVEAIAAEKELNVTTSTAAVKPRGGAVEKSVMIKNFNAATYEAVARLMPFADSASEKYKVLHPFFGLIPAKGWVFVLGEHQSIHRRQVNEIIKAFA